MNTFLAVPSITASPAYLDMRRLGKQRIEAKQILMCLTGEGCFGWRHHPAVKMWRGYEAALAVYGLATCMEWRKRGYQDNQLKWFNERTATHYELPPWMGDYRLHSSHRAVLLAKSPQWYQRWCWSEQPAALTRPLPYWWPSDPYVPDTSITLAALDRHVTNIRRPEVVRNALG